MTKFRILSIAAQDLTNAMEYYETKSVGLSGDFLEAQIKVFNRGAKEKAQLTMAVHPETRCTYPLKFQGKK